jgi:nucleoside 2-deoxyribosyltransferase
MACELLQLEGESDIAYQARCAKVRRFETRLATEDQRNGYEVGYYEALQLHTKLIRKIACGLRQVGKDMADRSLNEESTSDKHGLCIEAHGQYADRVNGYAAELEAALKEKNDGA